MRPIEMQELNTLLKKVGKGTAIVFTGSILGVLLGLIFRIVIVRYISPTEFGFLSLALVIVSILVLISSLGFDNSVPTYISYALGKKEYPKIWAAIRASVTIALFLSVVLAITLFLLAPWVSRLFHKPALIMPIRILVFTLPLSAIANLLIAILRGFGDVKAKVYLHSVFSVCIRVVLLALVIILGFSFRAVLYTYVIGSFLTLILLIHYAKNKVFRILPPFSGRYPVLAKELVIFSLPLLGTSISTMVIGWTDTLMLGYFKSADTVGLYNAVLPLSRFVAIPLGAMAFIYLPVASQLYAQGRLKEMKKLYASVTKWTFFITLPILLSMVLAPNSILHLLFGAKYINASVALQLLVMGEFIHTFLGPNGMTMISLGRTNIFLFCTLTCALSNIVLNLLLIPKYGLSGAAVAYAISLALANILISIFIFKFSAIHPFSKNYLKPISTTLIISLTLFTLNALTNWNIFALVILFWFLSLASVFVTKSIDQEDIRLLEALEGKIFKQNLLSGKLAAWCGVK